MPNDNDRDTGTISSIDLKARYLKAKDRLAKDERLTSDLGSGMIIFCMTAVSIAIGFQCGMGALLMNMSDLNTEVSISNEVIVLIQSALMVSAFISALLVLSSMLIFSFLQKEIKKNTEEKIKRI
jgi:hypothetical protein